MIVAGYGRVGQTVGRLLASSGHKTSVIDHDAAQVELLRGSGRKVNFGDATCIDLLRIAGAAHARLLVIALDDKEKKLELAQLARRHFPHLKIAARAVDRRHAYELMALGLDALERETFEGGVRLGVKSLKLLGYHPHTADRAGRIFRRYDEKLLAEMAPHAGGEFSAYQRLVRDRVALEEELIKRDISLITEKLSDSGWNTESLDREAGLSKS